MFRSFALSIVLLFALMPSARADALADALAAHERGDDKVAIEMLVPLAEAGDVTAMDTLSHIYWWGDGVTPDHAEALQWTRRSSDRGSARGLHDLALHHMKGDGVTQDFAVAAELYTLAADQGEPRSQTSLGLMKLNGIGVPVDVEAGIDLIRKAVAQGYDGAQQKLGVMAWKGIHVEQDTVEAVRLLELAAEQRDTLSQLALGMIYQDEGLGAADLPRAAMWFALAAKGGCEAAIVLGIRLRGLISAGQYQTAIEAANKWERQHPRARHNHPGDLPSWCFVGENENA